VEYVFFSLLFLSFSFTFHLDLFSLWKGRQSRTFHPSLSEREELYIFFLSKKTLSCQIFCLQGWLWFHSHQG
jgi:hypothetical protein